MDNTKLSDELADVIAWVETDDGLCQAVAKAANIKDDDAAFVRLSAVKRLLLAASRATDAPAPKGPMSEQNARYAIETAIGFGREGSNKPPTDDHWLMPYWRIGQRLGPTPDGMDVLAVPSTPAQGEPTSLDSQGSAAQGEQMPVALNLDIDAEHAEYCEWLDTVKEGARKHQTAWNGWMAAKTVAACKALAASPVAADKPVAQGERSHFEEWWSGYGDQNIGVVEYSIKREAAMAGWQARAIIAAPVAASADKPAYPKPEKVALLDDEFQKFWLADHSHAVKHMGQISHMVVHYIFNAGRLAASADAAPAGAVAVRNDALEEAAAICDKDATGFMPHQMAHIYFTRAATHIRALKSAAAEVTPAPATEEKARFETWWERYADPHVGHVEYSIKREAAMAAWKARAAATDATGGAS